MMKRKVQSACVEDVDPTTEEAIPATQNSASISPPAHESHLRRKIWRKSGQHVYESRDSEALGPVVDLLSKSDTDTNREILTVFASECEDNREVWADFERASSALGRRHRIFYLSDDIVNGESATYVARTIPISSAHDLSATQPSLIIAQRTLSPRTGRVQLRAHKLSFGTAQIDVNRPYIFSRLGDEIPGVAAADLHVTFRAVHDWDSVLKKASFGGFDRDVLVQVGRADVRDARRVVWDLERDCRVGDGEGRPVFGIAIEAGEFKGLAGEEGKWRTYPDPSGKRRAAEVGERELLSVKLIGVGPQIPGHSIRADVNVNFVLK